VANLVFAHYHPGEHQVRRYGIYLLNATHHDKSYQADGRFRKPALQAISKSFFLSF
jgi:hypothetical protein